MPGRSGAFGVQTTNTIVLTGGSTALGLDNSVWTSQDRGETWRCVCRVAAWKPRVRHALVHLPQSNRLVLFGGYAGDGVYLQDVWVSENGGLHWVLLSDKRTKWQARAGMGVVVKGDDCVMIMGGDGFARGADETVFNDVWEWRPGSGPDWHLVNPNAPWDPRTGCAAMLTSQGEIIVAGGFAEGEAVSDVWKSTDGKKWQKISQLAAPLTAAQPAALNDRLFMFAGRSEHNCLDEVWCSKDQGKSWKVLERGVEGFGPRCWSSVVVSPPVFASKKSSKGSSSKSKASQGGADDKDKDYKPLFIFCGGVDDDGICHGDVWSSEDARVWVCMHADPAPSPRRELIEKMMI